MSKLFLAHATLWLAFLAAMLGAWRLSVWAESTKATCKDSLEVEDETMEQLSMIDAMEARDDVLAVVDANNAEWTAEAMAVFDRCPIVEGIGESFRNWMRNEGGLRAPRSPKAWGAFFGLLKKRGLIVMTGELSPMLNAASRARLSPVYRRVVLQEQAA